EGATSAPLAAAPAAAPTGHAAVATAPTASATPPPATSAASSSTATQTASADVVTVAQDSRTVKSPARRLTAARVQGNTLQLSFDGEVRGYELIRLTGPSRLALDLPGVKLATSVRKGGGPFSTLRAGAHPDKVRLVVDVDSGLEGRVAYVRNGLRWTV